MTARYSFELYRDAKKQFRWRARHKNGHIVADCAEGYLRKADCRRAMQLLITYSVSASIVDLTKRPK